MSEEQTEASLDPLVEETLRLMEDIELREHLATKLPNNGENLEGICARGFARFEKDFDTLHKNLASSTMSN